MIAIVCIVLKIQKQNNQHIMNALIVVKQLNLINGVKTILLSALIVVR